MAVTGELHSKKLSSFIFGLKEERNRIAAIRLTAIYQLLV
jgi:hypothetical protein